MSISFRSFPGFRARAYEIASENQRQANRRGAMLRRLVGALPRGLREPFAERWLRRAGSPGPAAEHVFQYLRDANASKQGSATMKGADNFYDRQYRQYLNPTMGAYAQTAIQAVFAAGGGGHGASWSRVRHVALAMAEARHGASPLVVLDRETIAAAAFLPRPQDDEEARALQDWLAGDGHAPEAYRRLASGASILCAEPGVRAAARSASGAMINVVGSALGSGKLALLALHPYDPDAMGLHLTLFAVEALEPAQVEYDYGLAAGALDPWRRAAAATGSIAVFLVGGVEEAFTQCSQNLFVKRPRGDATDVARTRWTPLLPLDRLLACQFEILQATVSASGLPGVSPRNGELGMAGFVARHNSQTLTLVPYFAGNAVHGHAAKLWSNPWSSLLLWDDHSWFSAVTISGPTRIVEDAEIAARFPHIAESLAMRRRRNGGPAARPEYWFEQVVREIHVQEEPVAGNWLNPARAPCSLNAGGLAHHGKKPAYFAADRIPSYDICWQHEREALGRPVDPSGASRRYWEQESEEAFAARHAHLAGL